MFDLTKLEDNIYYYQNLYDNPDGLIKYLDNFLEWETWYSSSHSDVLYGEWSGRNKPLPPDVFHFLKNNITRCLNDYAEKTGNKFGWIPDAYVVQKYSLNKYMGIHTDSDDISSEKMPTVSAVLYLNDNYEGGELVFPEQNIKIKPTAASMVVFPSYPPYYHDPMPVTSGTKYMSTAFCFKEEF